MIVVGLSMILWPGQIAARSKAQYEARLAELRSGAEERFFEEERSLLAYPPRPLWRWTREWGFLLAAVGLAGLLWP